MDCLSMFDLAHSPIISQGYTAQDDKLNQIHFEGTSVEVIHVCM